VSPNGRQDVCQKFSLHAVVNGSWLSAAVVTALKFGSTPRGGTADKVPSCKDDVAADGKAGSCWPESESDDVDWSKIAGGVKGLLQLVAYTAFSDGIDKSDCRISSMLLESLENAEVCCNGNLLTVSSECRQVTFCC